MRPNPFFLEKVMWGLTASPEACLPSYHPSEKETVLVSLPGILLLKTVSHGLRFVSLLLLSPLLSSPPLPSGPVLSSPFLFFLQSSSLAPPWWLLFPGRGGIRAPGLQPRYLLPARTPPRACTYPGSLGRSPTLGESLAHGCRLGGQSERLGSSASRNPRKPEDFHFIGTDTKFRAP